MTSFCYKGARSTSISMRSGQQSKTVIARHAARSRSSAGGRVWKAWSAGRRPSATWENDEFCINSEEFSIEELRIANEKFRIQNGGEFWQDDPGRARELFDAWELTDDSMLSLGSEIVSQIFLSALTNFTDGGRSADCNRNADLFRVLRLKRQKEWRIAPDKWGVSIEKTGDHLANSRYVDKRRSEAKRVRSYIDLYWSILTYIDLYWPILIYIDLYWPILTYIDLYWSILVYIDLYWSILIFSFFFWFFIVLAPKHEKL